jgi:hypothetical protein
MSEWSKSFLNIVLSNKPFNNSSRGIITQDECINQLIKPHQIPKFSPRLTAKPVENGEQWETPVDKMVQSEKHRAAPQAAR